MHWVFPILSFRGLKNVPRTFTKWCWLFNIRDFMMPIPVTLRDLLMQVAQKPSVDNCIIFLKGIMYNYRGFVFFFFTAVLITRMCSCYSRAFALQATGKDFPKQVVFLNYGYMWNFEFSFLGFWVRKSIFLVVRKWLPITLKNLT